MRVRLDKEEESDQSDEEEVRKEPAEISLFGS